MTRVPAYAKLNLALVVGPVRPDGKHEVASVMQTIDLHDDVELEQADGLTVEGFADDTLVGDALRALAAAAGVVPAWRAHIEKRIPVAAGLGGGSSDAAAALRLANATLDQPLALDALHEVAASVGADVPFFLRGGTHLATGDGTELAPVSLPLDYAALVVLPDDLEKESTAAVYRGFDDRDGAEGFEGRRTALQASLARIRRPADLATLPPNDLASSPLAAELERAGAARADVSGAGPAVYGLFEHPQDAERAASAFRRRGGTWLTRPLGAA